MYRATSANLTEAAQVRTTYIVGSREDIERTDYLPATLDARARSARALMKPVQPDETLAAVVGSTPLPRGEMTKKLWDYIKKHKLQDETKRTMINADDALKAVFNGKKSVSMFEMTKLVSGHVK